MLAERFAMVFSIFPCLFFFEVGVLLLMRTADKVTWTIAIVVVPEIPFGPRFDAMFFTIFVIRLLLCPRTPILARRVAA